MNIGDVSVTAKEYVAEVSSTIEVKGNTVNEENKELLICYFKNEARSGGGNIINTFVMPGFAYITFETPDGNTLFHLFFAI